MNYQDYKRMNDALEYQYKNNGCSGSVLRIVNVDISKGLCQLNTGTVTYIANLVAATMSGMGCVSNPSMLAQWGGYSNLGASSAPITQNTTPVAKTGNSNGHSYSKLSLEIDEGVDLSKYPLTIKPSTQLSKKELGKVADNMYLFRKNLDKFFAKMGFSGLDYGDGLYNDSGNSGYLENKDGDIYTMHQEVSDAVYTSYLQRNGVIDDRMSLSIDNADASIAPYLTFDFATNSFSFYIYFFVDKNGNDEYYKNYKETATDLKELYQRITQPNSLFLQHFNKIVKIINGGN